MLPARTNPGSFPFYRFTLRADFKALPPRKRIRQDWGERKLVDLAPSQAAVPT